MDFDGLAWQQIGLNYHKLTPQEQLETILSRNLPDSPTRALLIQGAQKAGDYEAHDMSFKLMQAFAQPEVFKYFQKKMPENIERMLKDYASLDRSLFRK